MSAQGSYLVEFFAVGVFSYLGVFIRIELSRALNQYNDSIGPYSGVFTTQHYLISNVLGCFLIAIFVSYKDLISRYGPAGYIGLTSGLCGSLTTFSTWMVTNFEALFTQRNIGYFILRLAVQFSITWSAMSFGFFVARLSGNVVKVKTGEVEMQSVAREDIEIVTETGEAVRDSEEVYIENGGDVLDASSAQDDNRENKTGGSCSLTQEGWIGLILFTACTLALVIALIALENQRDIDGMASLTVDRLRCLVLAPAGAWIRWSLSKTQLKDLWPELHLHTLTANLVAVLIASCLFEFCHNQWTQSIITGFCGSLSTVSTFFSELSKLNNDKGPHSSARYLLVTMLPAVSIVMIVMQIKRDSN